MNAAAAASHKQRCPWCKRVIVSTGTAFFEAVDAGTPTFVRNPDGSMVQRATYVRHACPIKDPKRAQAD